MTTRKFYVDLDLRGVQRLRGLAAPLLSTDAVRKADLDAAVEGLAWKDNVKVATTANINLSAPGATVDGVAMNTGDRVLVKAQTAASANGIYIWNGAAVAMTRALDADSADDLINATVSVDQGSNAGTSWRQSTATITLGTTNIVFGSFGGSSPPASTTTQGLIEVATQAEVDAGTEASMAVTPQTLAGWANRKLKYAVDIGDGAATQYTITHNLNTTDVIVSVFEAASNKPDIVCDIERTGVNTVRLTFGTAPASNSIRVVVMG